MGKGEEKGKKEHERECEREQGEGEEETLSSLFLSLFPHLAPGGQVRTQGRDGFQLEGDDVAGA